MSVSNNTRGLVLAILSSFFIGASFIVKKKGLKRAGAYATPAGFGGYAYLLEPLWWAGLLTMFVGEVANFVAYIFAPAVLVTPLGALSIIVSAVLAHFLLKEKLQKMGILGCISCIVGSVMIVIHAPQEETPSSVEEIWTLATQPGKEKEIAVPLYTGMIVALCSYLLRALPHPTAFLVYVVAALLVVFALMVHFEPRYGQTNILVYLGICSLMGSLTVICIKAIGIAIKLTLEGISQAAFPQTWFFIGATIISVTTQLNYLNKALDTFNTAIVSPIYYVMFTTLTIVASAIMFKDWSGQSASSITSELCGFITVLSGTILLHTSREQEASPNSASIAWYVCKGGGEAVKIDDNYFVALRGADF